MTVFKEDTPLGRILTILALCFSINIFVTIKLEEFIYNNPTSITSIEIVFYHNFKFREEKIFDTIGNPNYEAVRNHT